jgi:hypothetical protein
MNNNAVQSVTALGAMGADFQVDGIGDFNGDHTSDILLHHDMHFSDGGQERQFEIIPIVNNTPRSPVNLGGLGTGVSVDGIGDFNGDGTSDIELHVSRTLLIDTIVNNTIQQFHALGGTGVDFLVS